MTCKKKRLKCDETRPSCVQCQKRSVVCEGYKKDYKWRTFEETTFNAKPATKKPPFRSNSFSADNNSSQPLDVVDAAPISNPQHNDLNLSSAHPSNSWSPGLHSAFASATQALQGPPHASTSSTSPDQKPYSKDPTRPSPQLDFPPDEDFMPIFDTNEDSPDLNLDGTINPFSLFSSNAITDNNSARSFSSGSPQLLDLLLPGTDLNQPPDPSEVSSSTVSIAVPAKRIRYRHGRSRSN